MPDEVPKTKAPVAAQEAPAHQVGRSREFGHHLQRSVDEYSQVLRTMPECNNPYKAFAPKPKHVHFESQAEEEQIILFTRQHIVTQIHWIVAAILLSFAPLTLRFVPILDFFPERFHLVFILGWYVFLLGYVLENFLIWFFNVNVFTDERIVDIDFYSLLYKKMSTAQIDRVEDVTSTTGGFFGSVLDYGTVDIQTAGSVDKLSFENVPDPEKVVQILNELIMEEEREHREGSAV